MSFYLDSIAPKVTITTPGAAARHPDRIIEGTSEPGASVTLYDETGARLGSAVVHGFGAWSMPILLSHAYETIHAEATDRAGNVGQSNAITFNSLFVTVTSNGLVNPKTEFVGGLSYPGAHIVIYEGAVAVGEATVGDDQSWSAPISLDGDGLHRLTAVADDRAGHTASSDPFTIELDSSPPYVAITSVGGTIYEAAAPVTGNAEPIAHIRVLDNGVVVAETDSGTTGHWSVTFALPGDGLNRVTAEAVDFAGNVGVSNSIDFTHITLPAPHVEITTPATKQNLVNKAEQIVAGTAGAGTAVYVRENGKVLATTTVADDGTWSTKVTLAGEGDHRITAMDEDAAGTLVVSEPVVFTLDDIAPLVAITSAGATATQAQQTVASTAERLTQIALYDCAILLGGTQADKNGNWSLSVTLAGQGDNPLQAQATDEAGNVGFSNTVHFTLDSVAPTVAITSAGGLVRDASQTVEGTGEAGTLVTLYDGAGALGSVTVGADGAWRLAVTLAGEGAHTLTAQDADAAGNVGVSNPVLYTLDDLAPTVAITTPSGYVRDPQETIAGTVEAGGTGALYDGDDVLGAIAVGGDGRGASRSRSSVKAPTSSPRASRTRRSMSASAIPLRSRSTPSRRSSPSPAPEAGQHAVPDALRHGRSRQGDHFV